MSSESPAVSYNPVPGQHWHL